MRVLQRLLVLLAALALLGPAAHVLELPNKLALDGALWLAVQQHLYRGWGPFIGAPVEIGALVASLALAVLSRRTPAVARPAIAATAVYAGMIGVFFLFNAPVNDVVDRVTSASLPPSWPALRLRWEAGHAISAALAVIGLAAAVRGWLQDLRIPRRLCRSHAIAEENGLVNHSSFPYLVVRAGASALSSARSLGRSVARRDETRDDDERQNAR